MRRSPRIIGFTAGIAIGAAMDNDYYYGPVRVARRRVHVQRRVGRLLRPPRGRARGLDRSPRGSRRRNAPTSAREHVRSSAPIGSSRARKTVPRRAERPEGSGALTAAQERSRADAAQPARRPRARRTESQRERQESSAARQHRYRRSGAASAAAQAPDAFSGYSSGSSTRSSSSRGQQSRPAGAAGGGGGRRR